jgi:hypothetical protein
MMRFKSRDQFWQDKKLIAVYEQDEFRTVWVTMQVRHVVYVRYRENESFVHRGGIPPLAPWRGNLREIRGAKRKAK